MNLASLFGAAGAGFKGYDEDQQEAAQKALLARNQQAQDEDRINRLAMAGFRPRVQPNPALNAALPPVTPQGGPSAPLDAALNAPKAPISTPMGPPSGPTATVTTANGPQTMDFDYDSSPEGLKERRDRAKELADQARQAALAKQKADEAEAVRVATQRRAYGSIQKYYKDDPSAQADFDPNANDYVKSFADLESQDRDTKKQIAVAKAQAAAQVAAADRAAQNENNKIREGKDAQGNTTYTRYDPATKTMVPITGVQPGAKGGLGGGGQMSGMTMQVLNRLGMSAKDIRASIQQMNDYETDPNGLAAVTPEMATKAQVATAQAPSENHGLLSTVNNAAGAFMTSKAQKAMADNTDLQRYRTYLFNKQRVGLAFGETLPRVNQEIIKMESMMSGGDLSQNPDLLKAIQERREYGASQLESMLGNMPGGGKVTAPTVSTQPHPQTGFSDAQVLEAKNAGAKTGADVRAYWAQRGVNP